MKLGSKYKFTEVQARHWEQFAQAAGLSKAKVSRSPRWMTKKREPSNGRGDVN